MTATYDPTLASDLDYVRFLVGDSDMTDPAFQDEEIAAVLGFQTVNGAALPYLTAADLLSMLAGKYSQAGQGKIQKTVSKLTLIWGINEDANTALQSRISWLRMRGAQLCSKRPFSLRIMGNSGTRNFPPGAGRRSD